MSYETKTIFFITKEEKQLLADIKSQILKPANDDRIQEYLNEHPEAKDSHPETWNITPYNFSKLVNEALECYLDGALF